MSRASSDAPLNPPPQSFARLVPLWLRDLGVQHYAAASLRTWASAMGQFVAWCDERGVTQANEITRSVMESYQRHLACVRSGQSRAPHQRSGRGVVSTPRDQTLTTGCQRARLQAVRRFFVWAVKRGYVPANPAGDLDYPRLTRRLPDVLSDDEVAAVLGGCDLSTPEGVRDRAFLEVLYSTGLRRSEAAALALYDLDHGRGIVRVRHGKGGKDRYVPIGKRALAWVVRYAHEIRPQWCASVTQETLFLRPTGEPITDSLMGGRVHRLLAAAGVTKRGACHLFRHTFATGLLENGCDIRLIGAMLGHSNLSATAVYTHVGVGMLVQAHAAFHPSNQAATHAEDIPTAEPDSSG